MFFDSEYLTSQIIAYIGNKRRLLPLIHSAITEIYGGVPGGLRFFDAFAGSGAVSRLGKALGFEVVSNDWEPYAYLLGRAYVEANARDLDGIFGSRRAFEELLDRLNRLPDPPEDEQYIARYYAPRDFEIEKADFRTERLFYTRSNALAVDKIRNAIDVLYPAAEAPGKAVSAREILIALLLYEAATHTNTSGVFKACHKGFGGHGKDALKRILAPIRLEPPPLIDSERPCTIFREDANSLVRSVGRFDLAYLDPPYNQHQYGSNYHLLNTIALWDRIPAPLDLNEKGRLREKAAIRKDWRLTKSDYCYRGTAIEAFDDLLAHLDAENVLVSYSTDGIIPFEDLKSLCESRGSLSIVTNEYTKYRGGKQSNSRKNKNIEFVLIVRRGSAQGTVFAVDSVLKRRKLSLLLQGRYCRRRLAANFELLDGGFLRTRIGSADIVLSSRDHFEIVKFEGLENLSGEETDILASKLEACLCASKSEELEEIFVRLNSGSEQERNFIGLVPDVMRKLAHKKSRHLFEEWVERAEALEKARPDLYRTIRKEMEKVKEIAERRFEN